MSRTLCALAAILVLLLPPARPAQGAGQVSGKPAVHLVRPGDTLGGIALKYGVESSQLRRWNDLPSDRIVPGQRLEIHTGASPEFYVVRRGDALSEIARHHNLSLGALRRLNDLAGDRIVVGQRLRLRAPDPSPASAAPSRATAPRDPDAAPGTHTVQPGESLSRIAASTGVSVARLRRLNDLSTDTIQPGQQLRLEAAAAAPAAAPTAARLAEYTVRRGDTLSEIALAYGLDLERLRQLNGLRGDTIRIGQKLRLEVEPPTSPAAGDAPAEYEVRPGDSLSRIAARFDVGLGLLRQVNGLSSDRIHPGQKLQLRPALHDQPVHVVRYGETLSEIAALYGLDTAQLRQINGLEGDRIVVGQKLRLRDAPTTTHIVEAGDALWEIARAYGVSVAEIKRLNGLSSDRIYPGQELKLGAAESARLAEYVVVPGDNLSEIARLHQMSIAELRRLNSLQGSLIRPGQKLRVRPLLGAGTEWVEAADIPWEELLAPPSGVTRLDADNGPYYGHGPRVGRQKAIDYYEGGAPSPRLAYLEAIRLWERFNEALDRVGRLSDALAGWHIVIDPGHGGLDPGAIVPSLDGDGQRLYVVEDEYCYDIALRAYALLRLHGARVDITILSPNHLIRHSNPPAQTFVNEKNEVYNSEALSRSGGRGEWPRGTSRGLRHRVQIARGALAADPRERTLFLSFHADIDRGSPEAPLILYYESRDKRRRDTTSRALAQALLPALGAGAYTRGQALAVLRDNPAQYKVLVEMRNLAYVDHAWALRFEQLRHRDAEKVVRGILEFAGDGRLARR
ncbi:MAG: LysM peptidoglycan-binding domain-containing protein [Gemmatimonadota bacterium]